MEMGGWLAMAIEMVAFDRRFLDRAVHPLDLAVGPRVLRLGEAMVDEVLVADPVDDMVEGVFVVRLVGELDAVIGQHGVDDVGHGCDQVPQEVSSDHLAGFPMHFDKGELAGAVDGYEQA